MDELTKLLYKQFALAQRACELQNQLGNVMQEYDELARQISELQEKGNRCDG